jgi:hypothetical protein
LSLGEKIGQVIMTLGNGVDIKLILSYIFIDAQSRTGMLYEKMCHAYLSSHPNKQLLSVTQKWNAAQSRTRLTSQFLSPSLMFLVTSSVTEDGKQDQQIDR